MVKRSVFQPKQAEFNLAIVNGEEVSLPSDDLYIPPNALKIFLESFEGPLDLLLYFIKKQNLNILEIDVSRITDQYVQYIELMEKIQFDLVGEYLVMAAYLTEIKSRMMLPKEFDDENEEDDFYMWLDNVGIVSMGYVVSGFGLAMQKIAADELAWGLMAIYLASIGLIGFREETEAPWRRGFGPFLPTYFHDFRF